MTSPAYRSWRPGPGPTGIREVVWLVLYREPVPPDGCFLETLAKQIITPPQDIPPPMAQPTILPWNWSKS